MAQEWVGEKEASGRIRGSKEKRTAARDEEMGRWLGAEGDWGAFMPGNWRGLASILKRASRS